MALLNHSNVHKNLMSDVAGILNSLKVYGLVNT
jgi:hypothetical protein